MSLIGNYVAIPTVQKNRIWLVTHGHLYILNTALHPVEKIEWCVCDLLIKDCDMIKGHCLVDSCTWHANIAINLDGT